MTDTRGYHHGNRSAFTLADCEAAVGKCATLPLTGRIVDAGESTAGSYVKFEVDDRWGLKTRTVFVMDLDPFEIEAVESGVRG